MPFVQHYKLHQLLCEVKLQLQLRCLKTCHHYVVITFDSSTATTLLCSAASAHAFVPTSVKAIELYFINFGMMQQ